MFSCEGCGIGGVDDGTILRSYSNEGEGVKGGEATVRKSSSRQLFPSSQEISAGGGILSSYLRKQQQGDNNKADSDDSSNTESTHSLSDIDVGDFDGENPVMSSSVLLI